MFFTDTEMLPSDTLLPSFHCYYFPVLKNTNDLLKSLTKAEYPGANNAKNDKKKIYTLKALKHTYKFM